MNPIQVGARKNFIAVISVVAKLLQEFGILKDMKVGNMKIQHFPNIVFYVENFSLKVINYRNI